MALQEARTPHATGAAASFTNIFGLSLSSDMAFVLVCDKGPKQIRSIDVATGTVTTVAGTTNSAGATDGAGTNTKFADLDFISISSDMSLQSLETYTTKHCAS